MSNDKYILIGQTPVIERNLLHWAEWYETADRIVGRDEIPGGIVSTVFLGLDHNFGQSGPPLLFETMVWKNGEPQDDMRRYATWADAEEGHRQMVAKYTPVQKGARMRP